LNAGIYNIDSTLYVKYDGVVLRGVGDGDNPANSTIIFARGNKPAQRQVIRLGSWLTVTGEEIKNTRTNITDNIVEVGALSFNVEDATQYKVGDRIIVNHPSTQAWIDAVDKGGVPYPDPFDPTAPDERWVSGQNPITYNRFITSIIGNKIEIDAPVFYTLNKSLSQSYIFKADMIGIINQVGLENLRIDVETLGGIDENHAWDCAYYRSCENAWAKNCTFIHFGLSGILTRACYRSSFINCKSIDPVSLIEGGRRYNFNSDPYSQLNLFSNCYASNGRHSYVSNGGSTVSGIVFQNCVSEGAYTQSEGHQNWTNGMLYDNHKDINPNYNLLLALFNRTGSGFGHGWSAVQSVLWNCDVDASSGIIGLQKPPTSQNYAIGCFAKTITGRPLSSTNFTVGYNEGQNRAGLVPSSLYEAQLKARKTIDTVSEITKQKKIRIFPSTVNDTLNIEFDGDPQEGQIRIFNMNGDIVYKRKIYENIVYLQLRDLTTGIYLLEFKSTLSTFTMKFTKS
jgi:hypothetical protein